MPDAMRGGFFPFNQARCVVIGFDLTDADAFTDLPKAIAMAERLTTDCAFVGVGNKRDLCLERAVNCEAARAFFESYDPPIPYFETSAKTGEGVDELLNHIVAAVIEKLAEREGRNPNDNSKDGKAGKKGRKGGKKKKKGDKCVIC